MNVERVKGCGGGTKNTSTYFFDVNAYAYYIFLLLRLTTILTAWAERDAHVKCLSNSICQFLSVLFGEENIYESTSITQLAM